MGSYDKHEKSSDDNSFSDEENIIQQNKESCEMKESTSINDNESHVATSEVENISEDVGGNQASNDTQDISIDEKSDFEENKSHSIEENKHMDRESEKEEDPKESVEESLDSEKDVAMGAAKGENEKHSLQTETEKRDLYDIEKHD